MLPPVIMYAYGNGSEETGQRGPQEEVILRGRACPAPRQEGARRCDRRGGCPPVDRANRRDGGVLAVHGQDARDPASGQFRRSVACARRSSTRTSTSATGSRGSMQRI